MFKGYEGVIRKESTGLIVWDVQEALVGRIFNREEFLGNLLSIIENSRKKNIPIFYTKITPLGEKFESPLRKRMGVGKFVPGDIVKEVYPVEGDVVLNKNTPSIFTATNFELLTRNAGITTLIFTGIATEIGVETSVRHASTLGYLPLVISDAVSSGNKEAHERSLKNMELMVPVTTTKELLELLSKL